MIPDLIDTHCHLTARPLRDQTESVIADAGTAGVSRMITVACVPDEIDPALTLARQHPQLRIAVGLHPHEASRADGALLARIARTWPLPAVVAVGEIGLDYHYDLSPRQVQQTVLRQQLDLAQEADLPVIIHCRDAHDDLVNILREHGYDRRRVVFHCFSGTPAQAAEIRDHGWRTSFTGIITFKNADDPRRACSETPLDQLMFETDAPYLSPEPVRHERPNRPANLPHTVRFAADLLGMSFADLAAATTANAAEFFGLETLAEQS